MVRAKSRLNLEVTDIFGETKFKGVTWKTNEEKKNRRTDAGIMLQERWVRGGSGDQADG